MQKIKSDPKQFYNFVKSKQNTKTKIGPFLDPDTGYTNSDPDFAANILSKQYSSVFTLPRQNWKVSDVVHHFKPSSNDKDILADLEFTKEDVEKACMELKSTSAAGPDGIPAIFLKKCRKELSLQMYYICVWGPLVVPPPTLGGGGVPTFAHHPLVF